MKFQLDYKDENDIPYHFKCLICRKVPRYPMLDIQCSIICCFKCSKYYPQFCSHELQRCNQVEQSRLDQITFSCLACLKKISANQKNKHTKVCHIYHSYFQLQSQENSNQANYDQNNFFCKYCDNFKCQGCLIMINKYSLGKKLIISEQAVQLQRQNIQICQHCMKQMCYFEINHHQITCDRATTHCELCKQTIKRDCYINHYQSCVLEFINILQKELQINQIEQNLLDLLVNQFNSDYRFGFQDNLLRCFFEDEWTENQE